MKLNIQLFGGRGQSSTGKKTQTYSTKDIKRIRDNHNIVGYELNGAYLLKSYLDYIGKGQYSWIINPKENTLYASATRRTKIDNGELIIVKNMKEGKEKLLELANKKKRGRK